MAVARIAKPRGLRGEVVADVLTDFPERFDGLETVVAVFPNGETSELKIHNAWFQKERIVLKFARVDTVEAAEQLRNAEICVRESEVFELEEDEFFDWQLEGCRVETAEGETIGTVRELMRTGGTEILVIEGEREILIPFASSICTEVDVESKVIRIEPPEGLLEL